MRHPLSLLPGAQMPGQLAKQNVMGRASYIGRDLTGELGKYTAPHLGIDWLENQRPLADEVYATRLLLVKRTASVCQGFVDRD